MVVAAVRHSTALSLVFVLADVVQAASRPPRTSVVRTTRVPACGPPASGRAASTRATPVRLPFRDFQGLGPLYIRQSCGSCHAGDGRGPGAVRKMVLVDEDGRTPAQDQSGLAFGHTIRPLMAAGATHPVTVPEDRSDVLVTKREPPAVFGRGFMEAVADSEIGVSRPSSRVRPPVHRSDQLGEYASEPNRGHSVSSPRAGMC